jgi:hypothetical protein
MRTTEIASDGSFRLDGVEVASGALVVARVAHQGVAYTSDFATVEAGGQEVATPLVVYEATEDPSSVLIGQVHLLASVVGEELQISEYHLVSNTGDRTYVGSEDPATGERTTLVFSLPDGATDLRFDGQETGERYIDLTGGFADTQPVRPGSSSVQVLFNYGLAYQDGMVVGRTFGAPVASIALLIRESSVSAIGEDVVSDGVLDTEAGPVRSYTAGPLAEGEPLAFRLVADQAAPNAPGAGALGRNTARETVIGLVALTAAVAIVALLWHPSAASLPAGRARSLVLEIAALDQELESGVVDPEAQRDRRASLKRRLLTLLEDTHRHACS